MWNPKFNATEFESTPCTLSSFTLHQQHPSGSNCWWRSDHQRDNGWTALTVTHLVNKRVKVGRRWGITSVASRRRKSNWSHTFSNWWRNARTTSSYHSDQRPINMQEFELNVTLPQPVLTSLQEVNDVEDYYYWMQLAYNCWNFVPLKG